MYRRPSLSLTRSLRSHLTQTCLPRQKRVSSQGGRRSQDPKYGRILTDTDGTIHSQRYRHVRSYHSTGLQTQVSTRRKQDKGQVTTSGVRDQDHRTTRSTTGGREVTRPYRGTVPSRTGSGPVDRSKNRSTVQTGSSARLVTTRTSDPLSTIIVRTTR